MAGSGRRASRSARRHRTPRARRPPARRPRGRRPPALGPRARQPPPWDHVRQPGRKHDRRRRRRALSALRVRRGARRAWRRDSRSAGDGSRIGCRLARCGRQPPGPIRPEARGTSSCAAPRSAVDDAPNRADGAGPVEDDRPRRGGRGDAREEVRRRCRRPAHPGRHRTGGTRPSLAAGGGVTAQQAASSRPTPHSKRRH
jgi:hypothetical protein